AEAGAHQLLEQVSLFVAALGRAETGQRRRPGGPARRRLRVADRLQPAGGDRQRLVPARLAKLVAPVGGHAAEGRVLRYAFPAHQRHCQPVRAGDIVEAEAPLDAQPAAVGRTVAAIGAHDLLALDLPPELAADAAERAQRVDLALAGAGDDRQ